jgi:hypothetical protein
MIAALQADADMIGARQLLSLGMGDCQELWHGPIRAIHSLQFRFMHSIG